jgi:hypothetical protein
MAHGIRLSTPLASISSRSSLSSLTSDAHSIDAEELMSEDATERKVGDLGQIVRERKLITELSSIFISNGSNINEQVCLVDLYILITLLTCFIVAIRHPGKISGRHSHLPHQSNPANDTGYPPILIDHIWWPCTTTYPTHEPFQKQGKSHPLARQGLQSLFALVSRGSRAYVYRSS